MNVLKQGKHDLRMIDTIPWIYLIKVLHYTLTDIKYNFPPSLILMEYCFTE